MLSKDYSLHEEMPMPDPNFPIKLAQNSFHQKNAIIFPTHWHEQLEFLYFLQGEALIECNSKPIHVKSGDLIIVNSNDLHQGKSLSEELSYYCIISDTILLKSHFTDICETKYIGPLDKNHLVFQNKIEHDEQIRSCIAILIEEFTRKETGFELAIKSALYRLLVLLIRNHTDSILSTAEYAQKIKNLKRFTPVLQYIESHYADKITLDVLCSLANMSRFHFCRAFKQLTHMTPNTYVNQIRIHHAEHMLRNTDMNVTEVGMATGFNNINYFSRLFKEYKKMSPSTIGKTHE